MFERKEIKPENVVIISEGYKYCINDKIFKGTNCDIYKGYNIPQLSGVSSPRELNDPSISQLNLNNTSNNININSILKANKTSEKFICIKKEPPFLKRPQLESEVYTLTYLQKFIPKDINEITTINLNKDNNNTNNNDNKPKFSGFTMNLMEVINTVSNNQVNLNSLQNNPSIKFSFIPKLFRYYPSKEADSYLIEELLGTSVETIFEMSHHHFSPLISLYLVKQMLEITQKLHLLGIIHRNLNPSHFLFSREETSNKFMSNQIKN